jgi:hypothetical protein
MAQVTIDTVAYPAWWATVTNVAVVTLSASYTGIAKSDVELLPEGVSFLVPSGGDAGLHELFPWSQINHIRSDDPL